MDVTVPLPVPAVALAVSVNCCALNVAVTDRAPLIVTAQVVLGPEQLPLQPANAEPLAAAAVRVTAVPLL